MIKCPVLVGMVLLSGCTKAFIDLSETTSMSVSSHSETTSMLAPPPAAAAIEAPPVPPPQPPPKRCRYIQPVFPALPLMPKRSVAGDEFDELLASYIETLLRHDREVKRRIHESWNQYQRHCR